MKNPAELPGETGVLTPDNRCDRGVRNMINVAVSTDADVAEIKNGVEKINGDFEIDRQKIKVNCIGQNGALFEHI